MLDKFYRKRYKILGGPGCGKTTKILQILSNYLKGGVNPDQVLMIGFAKATVETLKDRCVDQKLLDKEQVDVEVSNRTVTIVANSERKNFKWEETFRFELDPESTKATMVNGILDLVIEKKEKTSAKKIEIE